MQREESFCAVVQTEEGKKGLPQFASQTQTIPPPPSPLCTLMRHPCFPSPSLQSDHPRVRHAGGLRGSQHLPDGPERDAQLPGQELEREDERAHRPTDQQQLGKDAAPENGRAPEQRRENRKDWVAPTHPVPVPWSAAFRSVCMYVCVCVCALSDLLTPSIPVSSLGRLLFIVIYLFSVDPNCPRQDVQMCQGKATLPV